MMKITIAIVFLAAFVLAGSCSPATKPPCDCDSSVQELAHHAGFYNLPHSRAARMFYFFYESRAKRTDPLVLWLTGGPGCGSEIALVKENGPFQLSNMSLVRNRYGWNMVSNLLYVDQPTGSGFSYSSDENDIRIDEESVANDLYDFLQAFLKDNNEYAKNRFYITGESYAGHYIPALASRIQKGNQEKTGIHINLKGLAIGNGLRNNKIQYKSLADYALKMKLISLKDYDMISKTLVPNCAQSIKYCEYLGGLACAISAGVCEQILKRIVNITDVNSYDIRKKPYGGDFDPLVDTKKFFNRKCVQDALGVGKVNYYSCNDIVSSAMMMEHMRDLSIGIPALLENGIRVLIYVGEYDLVCNWIGNEMWVRAMEWVGAKQFRNSHKRAFLVDGVKAGELQTYGPLAFLKVYEAGHIALEMIVRWIAGDITKST